MREIEFQRRNGNHIVSDGTEVGVGGAIGHAADRTYPVHRIAVGRAAAYDRLGRMALAQAGDPHALQGFVRDRGNIHIQ